MGLRTTLASVAAAVQTGTGLVCTVGPPGVTSASAMWAWVELMDYDERAVTYPIDAKRGMLTFCVKVRCAVGDPLDKYTTLLNMIDRDETNSVQAALLAVDPDLSMTSRLAPDAGDNMELTAMVVAEVLLTNPGL